jgi:hypothetical protein
MEATNYRIKNFSHQSKLDKLFFLFFFTLIYARGFSQFTYPINMEGTYGAGQLFTGFGGTTTSIVNNPVTGSSCWNQSSKVLQINKGGQTWAGMEFALATAIPAGTFGVGGTKPNFCFDYYTTAPANYQILFKFDGDPDMYQVATVSGAWAQVCFTPPASSNGKNKPVIIFRNGTGGAITDPNFRLYVDNLNFYANGSVPVPPPTPLPNTTGSQFFIPPSTVSFSLATPGDWYGTQTGGAILSGGTNTSTWTTPILSAQEDYWVDMNTFTSSTKVVGPTTFAYSVGNPAWTASQRFISNFQNGATFNQVSMTNRIASPGATINASQQCDWTVCARNITAGTGPNCATVNNLGPNPPGANGVFNFADLSMNNGDEIEVTFINQDRACPGCNVAANFGCAVTPLHLSTFDEYPNTSQPEITWTQHINGETGNDVNRFIGYNYTFTGAVKNPRVNVNAIITQNCSLLPVELTSFNATCSIDDMIISWTTASELRNDYFLLEKSLDGYTYEMVNKIDSKGTGTSSSEQNYSYMDEMATSDYYYRLTQVDFDGKKEIFGPISIDCDDESSLFHVFPNPSQGGVFEILIQEKNKKGLCDLNIIDIKGSLILKNELDINGGVNKFQIREHLAPGVYFVEINNHDNYIKRKKIVVY